MASRHPHGGKEACLEADSSHLTLELCTTDACVSGHVNHVGLDFLHFKFHFSHHISAFFYYLFVYQFSLSGLPVLQAASMPFPPAFTAQAGVQPLPCSCPALLLCFSLLHLGPVVQTELLERLAVTIVIAAVLDGSV